MGRTAHAPASPAAPNSMAVTSVAAGATLLLLDVDASAELMRLDADATAEGSGMPLTTLQICGARVEASAASGQSPLSMR